MSSDCKFIAGRRGLDLFVWYVYDITDTKIRNRIIAIIQKYGFVRVQKSLFAANVSKNTMMMEYIYCPRRIYFSKTLKIPDNDSKDFKMMEGKRLHVDKVVNESEYLRKRIKVKSKKVDEYLMSKKLCISGKMDEILFFEDGTASPLDYKYSVYKGWNPDTYRIQLLFYAILIEENYGCTVNDGYIVYMRSKNRLERIRLFDDDYEEFFDVYNEMSRVLKNEVFPHITDNAIKCEDCPYGKICTRI